MVSQWFDRSGGLVGDRRRHHDWPKMPKETRLQRWFQRVAANSAFMRKTKQETQMLLKKDIADNLGLSSAHVTVVQCERTIELRSDEREFPLAVIDR